MSRRLKPGTPYLFLSTAPTQKEAHALSQKILNAKLAACVNVIYPAISFFSWKGKKEKTREAILIIKTVRSRIDKLKQFISKHHSYENPELIGWPIAEGSKAYLDWVKKSCS